MSLTEIIKKRISFSDEGDDRYVKAFGNRLNTLGYALEGGGTLLFLNSVWNIGNNSAEDMLCSIFAVGVFGLCGFGLTEWTQYGKATYEQYKRTEEHIKKKGKLRRRYLKTLVSHELGDTKLLGYCEIQGAYLAARKYNQLEVFNEVKKKYSNNVIPNF